MALTTSDEGRALWLWEHLPNLSRIRKTLITRLIQLVCFRVIVSME